MQIRFPRPRPWRGHGKPRSRRRRFAGIPGPANTVLFFLSVGAVIVPILFFTLPWFFAGAIVIVLTIMIWFASQPTPRAERRRRNER